MAGAELFSGPDLVDTSLIKFFILFLYTLEINQ
jgi:hypothetical protein